MKGTWILPLAMLAATACAAPKTVESTARVERRDTLRAVLAEELTVSLDDVIIIPPDSLRPRIVAAKVELRRDRGAQVSRLTAELESAEAVAKPAPKSPPWRPLWVVLAVGLGAYIAGAWCRK